MKAKAIRPRDKARTDRGFREFVDINNVRVTESSLACEGPHVWIFGGRIIANDGSRGKIQLSLSQAYEVVEGLKVFINEAEQGKLTEVP